MGRPARTSAMPAKKMSEEISCNGCGGTGFPPVAQPAQPGRKIYPAPCQKCAGKGRLKVN